MQYNPYTKDLKTKVFDIETAGLSPRNSIIISASFCDEDGSDLRQYFCDDPEAEYLLITKILEEFQKTDAIITYNGDSFDLPFVLNRAKKYGINKDYPYVWSIDIYRILKKYWAAGRLLPSLSQSSVERALDLQLQRTDKIDGGECIPLYNMYLAKGDQDAKDKILLHNADDVRQLARISSSLSFIPFHKVVYECGRYEIMGKVPFVIRPVQELSGKYAVNVISSPGLPAMSVFEEYFDLEYDSFSGSAKLEIFPKEMEDYQYVDLNEMPLKPDDFKDLDGFASDYLIIKQGDEVKYREMNRLISAMLRKIIEY